MPEKKSKEKKLPKKLKERADLALKKAALWFAKTDPTRMVISANSFYIFFLAIALGITTLLYGASFRVGHTPISLPEIPNLQAIRVNHMNSLVAGYPIEAMIPGIAGQSKITSAFLVSIAKKESNWGKRVPRAADGTDCYNYWGYTGAGSRGVAQGHACFGSIEEAITVVGGRLDYLVREYNLNTPEELIVWKCGWNCDGHSAQSVRKWVKDVSYYYDQVQN